MSRPPIPHPNPLYGDPARLARYEAILAAGHAHCAAMAATDAAQRAWHAQGIVPPFHPSQIPTT